MTLPKLDSEFAAHVLHDVGALAEGPVFRANAPVDGGVAVQPVVVVDGRDDAGASLRSCNCNDIEV